MTIVKIFVSCFSFVAHIIPDTYLIGCTFIQALTPTPLLLILLKVCNCSFGGVINITFYR
jgi:hypothetical protein